MTGIDGFLIFTTAFRQGIRRHRRNTPESPVACMTGSGVSEIMMRLRNFEILFVNG